MTHLKRSVDFPAWGEGEIARRNKVEVYIRGRETGLILDPGGVD
jgi:hypothetical protein